MFVLGLTGGIGCGKSTAAAICRGFGLPVLDADVISRQVTDSGGQAIPEIESVFGSAVLRPDGSLDRRQMSKLVFSDYAALDKLSQIVHRWVIETMDNELAEMDERKTKACVLDVPIPVRRGFLDVSDQVWVIWAADSIRLQRLAERGMAEEEARRRMAMQMTRDEYAQIADRVFMNDGSLAELTQQLRQALLEELGARGIRLPSLLAEDDGVTTR